MYSLFLLTSALSYLALLRALERGGPASVGALGARDPRDRRDAPLRRARARLAGGLRPRRPPRPAAAGALGLRRRRRARDSVLADRPRARRPLRRRRRRRRRGSTWSSSCWQAAGDFTAAFPVLPAVLVAAAAGLAVLPRETRLLAACAAAVPLLALVVARSSGSPETRHLIFLLPFLALAVGAGTRRGSAVCGRRSPSPRSSSLRSPGPGTGRPICSSGSRTSGRRRAPTRPRTSPRRRGPTTCCSATTRSSCRPGSRRSDFPLEVLPRADADLALHNLLDARAPARPRRLGLRREQDDELRALAARSRSPRRARLRPSRCATSARSSSSARAQPVVTPERYLLRAGQAMLVGKRLFLGDADINLPTIERAARALRGYGASRSLSTSSR